MNLRLFNIDKLSRSCSSQGHDDRKCLRYAEADVGDADKILRTRTFWKWRPAHVNLDLGIGNTFCLDSPREAKQPQVFTDLFHSNRRLGSPVSNHARDIVFKGARKCSADGSHRIRSFGIAT